jgi:hypothetical protein
VTNNSFHGLKKYYLLSREDLIFLSGQAEIQSFILRVLVLQWHMQPMFTQLSIQISLQPSNNMAANVVVLQDVRATTHARTHTHREWGMSLLTGQPSAS